MPSSTRHARTLSPPLTSTSYSNALTAGQQKMNIVTRLAIEGKSKKDWDGAAIRMYLKMSLPLDSITPGATIALFPEENLKILDSQVHPLDSNSVPYNFSSTTSPLLHKAARALNLPARSSAFYVSLADSVSSSSTNIPPLDDKYTGHVLVSGYHISYVLPKEFPRREFDSRSRRGSTVVHFMAAIDIWVPYLSRPPHAPFLLSIPVPRCLSNQIRLRIFPPGPSTSSSLASLSSAEEDSGPWELTADPHVTRSQSARLSRSHSYNNFADDESSDASTSAGFAEGCGIQGTFPSTDRIRIRWAVPAQAGQLPEAADGRRRVGAREVKANMTCTVLGRVKGKGRDRGNQGVLMKLDYSATCKGVWYPGVATLLGMDVGLEADECDVSWAPGQEPKWTITGGAGFTGFAVGGPPQPVSRQSMSRQSSADYPPSIYVLPSSPDGRPSTTTTNGHAHAPNHSATSNSSPSLLRAPLPVQNVADYSFESTPVTTPTGSVSSLASLTAPSSPERPRRKRASSMNGKYAETDTDIDLEVEARPPRAPITIHLNMNELLPPSKNAFTFSISGVVLVTPRSPPLTPDSRRSSPSQSRAVSDSELDEDPIATPRFRVFSSDKESVSTIVRNEAEQISVDVFNTPSKRDGKSPRTVLMKGNQIACGTDGARLIVRLSPLPASPPVRRPRESSDDSLELSHNRTRTMTGLRSVSSTSRLRDISMMSTARLQPRRDGPLMIPSVTATITPLLGKGTAFKNGYAVQVCLPAPSDADTEWLEFGLAFPSAEPSTSSSGDATLYSADAADGPPHVDIASASVEGVPVRFETSAAVKPHVDPTRLRLAFEETSGKEWISWVRVHVGDIGGGRVEVIYIVKGKDETGSEKEIDSAKTRRKGKQKEGDPAPLDILLPSFALPVGRLQVDLQIQEGYVITSLRTNLVHQQATSQGRRLLNYALDEFHYPRLSVCITPLSPSRSQDTLPNRLIWRTLQLVAFLVPAIIVVVLLTDLRRTTAELQAMRESATIYSLYSDSAYHDTPETITITTTVLTGGANRWWFTADNIGPTESIVTLAPSDTASLHPSDTQPPLSTAATTTATPFVTTTIAPTMATASEQNALIAAYDFPFSWPLRFNMSLPHAEDLSEAARTTVRTVLRGMGSVWQIFRKVLHYPLDPP